MVRKKIKKVEKTKPKTIAKKTVKASKKSLARKIVQKKVSRKEKKETSVKTRTTKKGVKVEKKEKVEENDYFAKWIAPEHIKTQQDMIIYYASAVLSVLAIIWFFRQGSFIVVVTFLILLIIIILHIYQEPRDIKLKIDLDGIAFGSIFFPYKDIKSFEVIEGEYFNILKFKSKNLILPVREIQIIDQDPRYIRAVLDNFLLEERQEESLFGFEKKNELDEYFSEEDFDAYLKEKEKLKKLEEREEDKTE